MLRAAGAGAVPPDAFIVHGAHGDTPASLEEQARVPALWLVDDEAAEQAALRKARECDDVARTPTDPAVLALRLRRLLDRRQSGAFDADQDALTGLANRRGFGRSLRRALDDLLPGDHKALVFIDLDGFKQINDRHGHEMGDRVLRALADRMSGALGPEDTLARLGGDEFGWLLSRYDAATLVRDAENLLQPVSRPLALAGLDGLSIKASAGLVTLRPGLIKPELLRRADAAVCEAKAQGRNRLVHFELIHGGHDPDADLQRFKEVTRMFSDRMARMVGDTGRQLVEAARLQALQDPLTGARNRGFFNQRLPREIERARQGGRPLAMALLDLDHFHDINATYGWPSGDAVLQRFVELATNQLRVVDWLARYGGEEFAVVLPDTGLDEAREVLERLRGAVAAAEFLALDGRRVAVTLSVGVAAWDPTLADATALADLASQACLAAKAGGCNRVVTMG